MHPTFYEWRCAQFALAAALTITQIDDAVAHGFAGDRFFPATILTDDPFVASEISLPTFSLDPTQSDGSREFDIGPEYYNFCDIRFIGEPVLRDRIFPPVQNVTYITNTVNVTNIYVQNNVVYNYGPNYNVVNEYSSRPIQKLKLEQQTNVDVSAAAKSGGDG